MTDLVFVPMVMALGRRWWRRVDIPSDLYRWRGYKRTLKLRGASSRLLSLVVRFSRDEQFREASVWELVRRTTDEQFVKLMEDFVTREDPVLERLVVRVLEHRDVFDSRRLLYQLASGVYLNAARAETDARDYLLAPAPLRRVILYESELARIVKDRSESSTFRFGSGNLLMRLKGASGFVNSSDYRWTEDRSTEDDEPDSDPKRW